MEQVEKHQKLKFSRDTLITLHYELRTIPVSDSHLNEKVVAKYIPQLINDRKNVNELLKTSNRSNIKCYLLNLLNCLESSLDILLRKPLKQTDEHFLWNDYQMLAFCLRSHHMIPRVATMYLN